jgi:hypothetical protein
MVIQIVAGTIASFLVGMIWFSSYEMWWSYTFKNKKYGECTGPAVGYVRHQKDERERERWRDRYYYEDCF